MIDKYRLIRFLENYLDQLIKRQRISGQFIEWEVWFQEIFNPSNSHYIEICRDLKIASKNFHDRAHAIMINDCSL
jgi:hypothetical protein